MKIDLNLYDDCYETFKYMTTIRNEQNIFEKYGFEFSIDLSKNEKKEEDLKKDFQGKMLNYFASIKELKIKKNAPDRVLDLLKYFISLETLELVNYLDDKKSNHMKDFNKTEEGLWREGVKKGLWIKDVTKLKTLNVEFEHLDNEILNEIIIKDCINLENLQINKKNKVIWISELKISNCDKIKTINLNMKVHIFVLNLSESFFKNFAEVEKNERKEELFVAEKSLDERLAEYIKKQITITGINNFTCIFNFKGKKYQPIIYTKKETNIDFSNMF